MPMTPAYTAREPACADESANGMRSSNWIVNRLSRLPERWMGKVYLLLSRVAECHCPCTLPKRIKNSLYVPVGLVASGVADKTASLRMQRMTTVLVGTRDHERVRDDRGRTSFPMNRDRILLFIHSPKECGSSRSTFCSARVHPPARLGTTAKGAEALSFAIARLLISSTDRARP
jgi:hypothetical protein